MDPNPIINITSCDRGPEFCKKIVISDGHLEAQDDQSVAGDIPVPAEIKT